MTRFATIGSGFTQRDVRRVSLVVDRLDQQRGNVGLLGPCEGSSCKEVKVAYGERVCKQPSWVVLQIGKAVERLNLTLSVVEDSQNI